MIRSNVRIRGLDDVERNLARLKTEAERSQAIQMAVNKAASRGVTAINKEVTSEFKISARDVRGSVKLRPASKRMNQLQAAIEVFGSPSRRGRSMNLVHFLERAVTMAQARKRMKAGEGGMHTLRRGGQVHKALELRFEIKRGGGKKVIKGAFLGNKGRTVFVRVGKNRVPIDALQVIGVSQMFNTKRINARVITVIRQALPVETARAVTELLRRANAARKA